MFSCFRKEFWIEDEVQRISRLKKEKSVSQIRSDVRRLLKRGSNKYPYCSSKTVMQVLSLPILASDAIALLSKLKLNTTNDIYSWLFLVKNSHVKAKVLLHFCTDEVQDNMWHTREILEHNKLYSSSL